ncbi:hypothetical protein F5X96DRAFT_693150 [Biscogniauxia mediterranea]|nr:hypothetical protein F5X96DRAFT_693150 [Biscogniauxia mediterranea]
MAPSLEAETEISATPQYYPSEIRHKLGEKAFSKARLPTQGGPYADINYEFDEQKYLRRRDARVQAGGLRTDLPEGWPKAFHGPLAWKKSDISDDFPFIYRLTDCDEKEIDNALTYCKALGKKGSDVTQSAFPLPHLAGKLAEIRENIYNGRGFSTIRGLDVDKYSPDDLVIVYLGITSYIGETRGKQNQEGVMMINVMNISDEAEKENARLHMPFHTDLVCDTVGLLTVACGEGGGSGFVASAWTVYNELAATRPDLIHVLAEPDWPFDTHGRDPAYYQRAIMYHEDGKLLVNFSKQSLVGQNSINPRTPGIPGLTEAQAEALDALDYIGSQNEYNQASAKGDIRLFNNLALMHRRAPYTDGGDNHRHLLRLWIHNDAECWQLPEDLRLAWNRTFKDPERPEVWHFAKIDAQRRRYVTPLWQNGDPDTPPASPYPIQPAPPCLMCD